MCKFDDTLLDPLPTGYLSLPHIVSNFDKEWLADIHKALHPCSYGTFDRYNAVLPFLQAAMMPRGHRSCLFLKKDDVFFLYWMFCLLGCLAMLNELGMTYGVIRISAVGGLHGLQECSAEARLVHSSAWDG